MQVNLVMFKPDGQRKDIPVHFGKTVVGRRQDCDLQIPLVGVSRQHAELMVDKDGLRVRDLASSNGTYINGTRVNQARLKAGDRLAIGPIVFTVQVDGKPESIEQPTPASPEAKSAVPGEAELLGEEEVAELDIASEIEEDPISALESLAQEQNNKKK